MTIDNNMEASVADTTDAKVEQVQSRESRMVVIERNAEGTPTVWCDPEIEGLVRALNAGGIRTVASCSGHGERPGNIALADGRELLIAASFDEARRMETAEAALAEARNLLCRIRDDRSWRTNDNDYRNNRYSIGGVYKFTYATHWMPLPPPAATPNPGAQHGQEGRDG